MFCQCGGIVNIIDPIPRQMRGITTGIPHKIEKEWGWAAAASNPPTILRLWAFCSTSNIFLECHVFESNLWRWSQVQDCSYAALAPRLKQPQLLASSEQRSSVNARLWICWEMLVPSERSGKGLHGRWNEGIARIQELVQGLAWELLLAGGNAWKCTAPSELPAGICSCLHLLPYEVHAHKKCEILQMPRNQSCRRRHALWMSVKRLAVIPHVAALESGAEPHVFDLDQLFADMIALQREGKNTVLEGKGGMVYDNDNRTPIFGQFVLFFSYPKRSF